MWDVKEPTPLFEKSWGRRPRCCGQPSLIKSFTSWDGWVQKAHKWTERGCQWRLCVLTSELSVDILKYIVRGHVCCTLHSFCIGETSAILYRAERKTETWRLRQLRKRNTTRPGIKMKIGSLPLCRLINIRLTPRGPHRYSCMNRVKCNRHVMENE